MAFAVVASKRAPLAVAGLLKKFLLAQPAASASASGAAPSFAALRPACSVATRRLFSNGGAPFRRDGSDSEQEAVTKDISRERVCMGRMLAAAAAAADEAAARGCCGCWVMTEDVDAVKLKVAMPGLGKEHVMAWAEEDNLMIEVEGVRDPVFDDDDEDPARYRHRTEFPKGTLKMDQMKAEMKHGALKVTLPKIKLEEERTDVFEEEEEEREERRGMYGMSRHPRFVVV